MVPKINQYKARCGDVHKGKYSYDLWTSYSGDPGEYHKKIPIICPNHGQFDQSLANHIRGAGCPDCRAEARKRGFNKKTVQHFVERATAVHGNTYDYSQWEDVQNTSTDCVKIICRVHGMFEQTPASHIDKQAGCPSCAVERRRATALHTCDTILPAQSHIAPEALLKLKDAAWLAKQHHEHKRTLENIANELSVQDTTVGLYFRRHGIEVKRFPVSAGERAIVNYVRNELVITNTRTVIPPQEIDILLPECKLAIEYCGLYWHSDLFKTPHYHADKMNRVNAAGYRLITIFEDEWINKSDLIKTKLDTILHRSVTERVHARLTSCVQLSREQKREFFLKSHIQGPGPATVTYGLAYSDEIVAAASFIIQNHIAVLSRYATTKRVPGGLSKLLRHFHRTHPNIQKIESFADLRWSEGAMYSQTGFMLEYTIPPDYFWTDGKVRHHKFGFRHKLLERKLSTYDPTKTETENCRANGLFQIWDCGKQKWVLTF